MERNPFSFYFSLFYFFSPRGDEHPPRLEFASSALQLNYCFKEADNCPHHSIGYAKVTH
jgi:hypothetical protein